MTFLQCRVSSWDLKACDNQCHRYYSRGKRKGRTTSVVVGPATWGLNQRKIPTRKDEPGYENFQVKWSDRRNGQVKGGGWEEESR
jgi:hypothetical protein